MIAPGKAALALSVCLLSISLAEAGSARIVPAQTTPDPATKAMVEKVCSECHEFTQVSAQHKNADQWTVEVKKMIEIGAPVSEAQVPQVVTYLTQNYGPAEAR